MFFFLRSCVSLSSFKDILSSYEEFKSHFSSNIVQYNWSEGLDKETVSCQNKDLQSREATTVQGSNRGGESTRQGMDIQPKRKPPLKCTVCDFTASSITALKRHNMRHTGNLSLEPSEITLAFKQVILDFTSKESIQTKL